jgi:hypothetical protein
MADESHTMTVEKNRLLYDKATLDDVRSRLSEEGIPPKATEIKHAVKTTATIYEIRTALTYWFGGRMSHRESERVWKNCEAFEKGDWALDGNNEIVNADKVNT